MAKSYKPRSKFPALVTYIIALLALICGLVLPLGTDTLGSGIDFGNMPALQLTGALAALGILKNLPFGIALTPAYSYNFSAFGFSFDLGAALLLLYALFTVLALILLLPVCISNRHSSTARSVAAVAEILALVALIPMFLIELVKLTGNWNLSVIIPLCVTLLMLILQSIIYFKGSGVIKTIVLLFSSAALFVTTYNITSVIPALAGPVSNLMGIVSGSRPFETATQLYSLGGISYNAGMVLDIILTDFTQLMPDGNWTYLVAHSIALGLLAITFVNLFFDVFGLGKRTTKGMVIGNLARYLIQFILAAALAVVVFWVSGNFGILLYFLLILTIVQVIIAIARRASYKVRYAIASTQKTHNRKKEKTAAEPTKTEEPIAAEPAPAPVAEAAPAEQAPVTAEPLSFVAPVAAPVVAPVVAPVATNEYSNSDPGDEFLRKLTNDERAEFIRVFLGQKDGNLSNIPDYRVGGDNSNFFSSVFIYFARVRELVSDGLMNKLYQEVR